uniref:Amine oxidase n=1 Tax=Phallusia mammillata TaxID=59560 RepID=A0A6F9DK20_9ASCI|nr:probable flavin-containing monoamine oxidase A [Phallusia mammillata]
MPDPVCVDVVVIGAGISGLAAAHELQQLTNNKLDVIVLEAKERIGGRLCGKTLPAANGTDEWDLGGQWVSSSQVYVLQLLEEFGLGTFPQFSDGEKKLMVYDASDIRKYNGLYPSLGVFELLDLHLIIKKVDKMAAQIPLSSPASTKLASKWDSITLQTFIDQSSHCKSTADVLALAMRTVFGAEPSQISFFYFLYYCALSGGLNRLADHDTGDAQELRVQETASTLPQKLKDKIGAPRVKCNQPVVSIKQTNSGSCVITSKDGTTYQAQFVIIAIPPHLVNQISFSPELPVDRRRLGDRMPVGHLIKFIATYKSAFWKNAGASGETTTVLKPCSTGPLCVTMDATSFKGNPALVGFIGGEHATYWTHKSVAERQEAVVESLVSMLGQEASNQLVHYEDKDWGLEPYNGGCPVSVMQPGCLLYFHHALREPFGRVHWAGTETARIWTGYIDGAVEAGQRAANEVVQLCKNTNKNNNAETCTVQTSTTVSPAFKISNLGHTSKKKITATRAIKGICILGVLCGAGYMSYKYLKPQVE